MYHQCDKRKGEKIILLLKQWHHSEISNPPMWIWETLKQLSDKYLLTGMESKIDVTVATKRGVKTTKSPKHAL